MCVVVLYFVRDVPPLPHESPPCNVFTMIACLVCTTIVTRFRDVVGAYKATLKEKEALESSIAAWGGGGGEPSEQHGADAQPPTEVRRHLHLFWRGVQGKGN